MVHNQRGFIKLEYIVSLVKQLFYISVITAFLASIMPNEKYQRLIKNICGLITILILIGPFFKIADLENTFQKIYNSVIQRQELENVKLKAKFQDNSASEDIIEQCRARIDENIAAIVLEAGLYPAGTVVTIDSDASSKTYGSISMLEVYVSDKKKENEDTHTGGVIKIAPIDINTGTQKNKNYTDSRTEALSDKIAGYYGVDKKIVKVWYKT